jgi:hypothetical protein
MHTYIHTYIIYTYMLYQTLLTLQFICAICIYIYTYIYIYIYMCVCVKMPLHSCFRTCVHLVHLHVSVSKHTWKHTYVGACPPAHMEPYVMITFTNDNFSIRKCRLVRNMYILFYVSILLLQRIPVFWWEDTTGCDVSVILSKWFIDFEEIPMLSFPQEVLEGEGEMCAFWKRDTSVRRLKH